MKIEKKVMDMSLAGIFTAIIIAMSVVPFLGYIPLGFMNATIIHVPVIIGALLLGPKYGAWLGFVFGMTSLIKATLTPTVTSFVFSPFITIGGYSGKACAAVRLYLVDQVCNFHCCDLQSQSFWGKLIEIGGHGYCAAQGCQ